MPALFLRILPRKLFDINILHLLSWVVPPICRSKKPVDYTDSGYQENYNLLNLGQKIPCSP